MMADAIIPHSPTLKNSLERKIFYWHFTLQVLTVRLSFSVQRCHMCVRVGSYTPAAVCFCVCVCAQSTHRQPCHCLPFSTQCEINEW